MQIDDLQLKSKCSVLYSAECQRGRKELSAYFSNMGVKRNFVYSSILTTSNYIFPLVTFPYISRVLGVTNIGICNFVDSIVYYFIMFSMMGITFVGIREIAKANGNQERLNLVFSRTFKINLILTVISVVAYLIFFEIRSDLKQFSVLYYVGLLKLISNLFLVEWFFNGTENFRFITIRSLIVKTLYVISLFLFVRESSDYTIYYFLTCAMVAVNALVNWHYKRNFVKFSFSVKISMDIIRPVMVIGLFSLLTSMYNTFNVVYLGFVAGPTDVGYYTTASKLYTILLALYSAFTGVMLPRISRLLEDGEKDKVINLLRKAFEILFICSPIVIFSAESLAPDIIYVLSGKGYEGAIVPMMIILPLVLIVGIEQILILQILMPLKQDKSIFYNSIIGAIVGITLNLLLVSSLKSIGSSVSWVLSEIVVMLCSFFYVRRLINVDIPYRVLIRSACVACPIMIIGTMVSALPLSPFVEILIAGALVLAYLFAVRRFYLKNELINNTITCMVKKIGIRYE